MISRKAIFVLSIVSLFLLASCSSECKLGSDCPSAGLCKRATCDDGVCGSTVLPNCCGNGIAEQSEDGEFGSECTCPEDHGDCSGKITIGEGSKARDADYLGYSCSPTNTCVFGVSEEDVNQVDLSFPQKSGFFEVDTFVSYPNPLVIDKDSIDISLKLTDTKDDLVPPVTITAVKVLEGQTLFGFIETTGKVRSIGDRFDVSVPVSYEPPQPEDERRVTLQVDYEYTKRVKVGTEDGEPVYEDEVVRDEFKIKLTNKVFFVEISDE